MQEKTGMGFFLEAIVVVVMLSLLSAVAIPNVGQLIHKGKTASYESELHNIQTAVIGMLADSAGGTIEPAGPTADMSLIRTRDTPPLVLAHYMVDLKGTLVRSGCTYIFAVDGTVTQVPP